MPKNHKEVSKKEKIRHGTRLFNTIKEYLWWDDVIALLLMALGVLFHWANIPENPSLKWQQIYHDTYADMIGIGITVIILGNFDQYLRVKSEKKSLILQMGSPNQEFAIEAVRQLNQKGWLVDGTTRHANLSEANLEMAILFCANLEGANLPLANLKDAYLVNANLKEAYLSFASLKDANLSDANLEGAELSEAHLEGANLESANLKKANLTAANLEMAYLFAANLEIAKLFAANLKEANLTVANLEGANLFAANLKEADLSFTSLKDANLSDANLEGANLKGADLHDATYNDQTIWPAGFNPEEAGAKLKKPSEENTPKSRIKIIKV